jgi:hypothetical protein
MRSLFFLYCGVILTIAISHNFALFRVPVMTQSFADLRLITSASECSQLHEWNLNSISCDPWGRAFNYPSVWVQIFAFFHITQAQTDLLGCIEIILLCFAIFYWINLGHRNIPKNLSLLKFTTLIVLLLFSPPLLLLMERGNIDMLIFAGLTYSYHLLRKQRHYFGAPFLAFLGLLKIYPFIALLWVSKTNTAKALKFLYYLLALLSFSFIFRELSLIVSRSELPWTYVSYGVSQIILGVSQKLHHPEGRILSAALSIFIFFIAVLLERKTLKSLLTKIHQDLSRNTETFNPFSLFSLVFLGSYLLGTSFDYRLILLFPVVIGFIPMLTKFSYFLIAIFLIIAIFYGGHLAPLLVNIASDFVLFIFSVSLFAVNFLDWPSKVTIRSIGF